MALDYAGQLARTRSALMESSNTAIWTDADLLGAIRLALEEINLTLGQAYALKDLDSAAATTLPASLEGTLTVGSGMYATGARVVDRAENYELANESGTLKGWWDVQRSAFDALLSKAVSAQEKAAEETRLAALRASAAPFGEWADDFGEKGASELYPWRAL